MVSEFFRTQINMAHQMMNEGAFDQCIMLLKNLKLRIHDKDLKKKFDEHDNTIDKEFKIKYNAIAGDPLEQYNAYVMLQHWKAAEYIRYYDEMSKTKEAFDV